MTFGELVLFALLGYCVLDLILAVVLRKCVLPGLRCPACRKDRAS